MYEYNMNHYIFSNNSFIFIECLCNSLLLYGQDIYTSLNYFIGRLFISIKKLIFEFKNEPIIQYLTFKGVYIEWIVNRK